MDSLNLTDINIVSAYNPESDIWQLQASNMYLKAQAELKYEAVLAVTKEIFKVIQEIQPELDSFLELNLDYHRERKGIFYMDFRKKGNGLVTEVLLDESTKPELKVMMAWEHFIELVSGGKDPQTMFMNGQLKMTGNLVKALKIQNRVKI